MILVRTLKDRRDFLCEKYFRGVTQSSHKLHNLLPEKRRIEYDLRPGNTYPLSNRYRNSLIPWGLNHCNVCSHNQALLICMTYAHVLISLMTVLSTF